MPTTLNEMCAQVWDGIARRREQRGEHDAARRAYDAATMLRSTDDGDVVEGRCPTCEACCG